MGSVVKGRIEHDVDFRVVSCFDELLEFSHCLSTTCGRVVSGRVACWSECPGHKGHHRKKSFDRVRAAEQVGQLGSGIGLATFYSAGVNRLKPEGVTSQ